MVVSDALFFSTQGLRSQVFIEFSQVFIVFCMFTNKHSSHMFADKYKKVRGFFFLFADGMSRHYFNINM